jgi:hypothetical protein
MKHVRSADPWSAFLDPDERVPGSPGSSSRQLADGFFGAPDGRAHEGAVDGDMAVSARQVLQALSNGHGALTVEHLHDRTGLTLLEVAEAVRDLCGRGLVGLRRVGDEEVVQVTGAGHAGPTG